MHAVHNDAEDAYMGKASFLFYDVEANTEDSWIIESLTIGREAEKWKDIRLEIVENLVPGKRVIFGVFMSSFGETASKMGWFFCTR